MTVCVLSRQIILCQNATGDLSFLWRKKTIFIYFMVISFAVYERDQNLPPQTTPHQFCPKFGRSPIQWKIIDTKRKTLPGWYKFSRWFLALSLFSPFTLSLMAWQESEKNNFDKFPTFHRGFFSSLSRRKVISCGRSYTSHFAFIKMNKKRF